MRKCRAGQLSGSESSHWELDPISPHARSMAYLAILTEYSNTAYRTLNYPCSSTEYGDLGEHLLASGDPHQLDGGLLI